MIISGSCFTGISGNVDIVKLVPLDSSGVTYSTAGKGSAKIDLLNVADSYVVVKLPKGIKTGLYKVCVVKSKAGTTGLSNTGSSIFTCYDCPVITSPLNNQEVDNINTGFYIKWNSIKGVNKYDVKVVDKDEQNKVVIGASNWSQLSYYVGKGSLTPGHRYAIFVQPAGLETVDVNNAAPSGLFVVKLATPYIWHTVDGNMVRIFWNPVESATTYSVFRKDTYANITKEIASLTGDNHTYIDPTCWGNRSYEYSVVARRNY